jgi:raffinose/stachyose/melibiose transport system substrate-binding protein
MAGSSKTDGSSPWINGIGLLLLLVCYVGAIWNIFTTRRQESRADIIRMVHWQLELGVRDGIQAMIDEFEAYKLEQGETVEVIQIPIPERVYNQYVTTQLIGGTAPDMIQLGQFPVEYQGRFFFPLSKIVQEPNPFLKLRKEELVAQEALNEKEQRELDALKKMVGAPWMDSFDDGLRSRFNTDFQEYFGIGFSTFTVRMYYNKDMFRKVLGHDRAPTSYEELIAFSDAIIAFGEETGEPLLPIASSQYQVNVFKNRYFAEITPDLNRELDVNFTGTADGFEKLAGMIRGEYSPWNPEYRAAVTVLLELAEYFPKGFMSLGREDSGFSFVQGKSGMITSGSWDALSYLKKIQDQPEERRFEVGIFDLPSISQDHPRYGQFADGRASEADSGTGFAFGITRYTRNFDLCVEFLQFATTPEMNTKLNEIAGWIPVIRGATPRDLLKNFQPNYIGYFGSAMMEIMGGGKVKLEEDQLFWVLIEGNMDYETYAEELWGNLPAAAATDYKRMYEGALESLPNRNLRRSSFLANVVFGDVARETRVEREIKLLRSMQPLMTLLNTQPSTDALMEQARSQIPDDPQVQEFVEKFDRALQRELTQ